MNTKTVRNQKEVDIIRSACKNNLNEDALNEVKYIESVLSDFNNRGYETLMFVRHRIEDNDKKSWVQYNTLGNWSKLPKQTIAHRMFGLILAIEFWFTCVKRVASEDMKMAEDWRKEYEER